MKHTKEPWEVLGERAPQIIGEDKVIVLMYSENILLGKDKRLLENAQRIVACVNACKGLTNEVLDKGILDDAIALVLNAGKDIGVTWDDVTPYYEGVKVWEEE